MSWSRYPTVPCLPLYIAVATFETSGGGKISKCAIPGSCSGLGHGVLRSGNETAEVHVCMCSEGSGMGGLIRSHCCHRL